MKTSVGVVVAVDQEQFHRNKWGNMRDFRQNGRRNQCAAPPARARLFLASPPGLGYGFGSIMADHSFESGGSEERVWDEYDWERFLQQQDRKTEKYMELLEKYLDDPNRDQIIAKEMGWNHLLDENGKDWSANLDSLFKAASNGDDEDEDDEDDEDLGDEGDEDEEDLDEDDEDEDDEPANRFDNHPLYQAANALAVHIDGMFDEREPASQHPTVVRLSTSATLTNVKLAAALSDDEVDELGMTIAYLKRALKAVTNALDAASQCRAEHLIDRVGAQDLRARIFQVRDGIVTLMGEYRSEWRRRYGK